jgi:predicted adenine nucleotide alpha hydrolase (AANH) superfamily ATPase
MPRRPILAHICCGPDALYVVGLLQSDYDVIGFFYNPNIWPPEEYALRLEVTKKVREILNFPLLEGPYDHELWAKSTRKFKDEPEKGRRCDICYALRLKRTAEKAVELGLRQFATVMSLSPWKKVDALNRIGSMFGRRYGLSFLEANFKKKAGFEKSVELSRRYGLYRQNYCGCSSSHP